MDLLDLEFEFVVNVVVVDFVAVGFVAVGFAVDVVIG